MKIDEMTQGCTNSTVNYTDLLGCVNLLNKAKDEYKEVLKADFISALERVGKNEHLVKEVREKGLPSHIIVSSDLLRVCHEVFSKYAKVIQIPEQSEHNDKPTILMAWAGMDYAP